MARSGGNTDLFKGGARLKIGHDKEIVITGPLENSS